MSLPKFMEVKEFCDVCQKEMKIISEGLSERGDSVEVCYECVCGYHITFAYLDKFVQAYKDAAAQPESGAPGYEMPAASDVKEGV